MEARYEATMADSIRGDLDNGSIPVSPPELDPTGYGLDRDEVRGEVDEFPEPEQKTDGSGSRFGELNQITEPVQKLHEQKTYEITEPVLQITEPGDSEFTELGQEINTNQALAPERRLWNLETYGDRHGKRRLRRSLRFVKKPCRVELGQVTSEFELELKSRPGRGRWTASRTDAELFKRFAQSVAKSVERDKRAGRKRSAVSKKRRTGGAAGGGEPVPPPPTNARWPEVPDVLM